jgi:hypothetical protein
MHCVGVREGRRTIRSRTLVSARRCLAAIEASLTPRNANVAALATVMAEMARTDIGLAALLGQVDGLTPIKGTPEPARCGRDRMTRAHQ